MGPNPSTGFTILLYSMNSSSPILHHRFLSKSSLILYNLGLAFLGLDAGDGTQVAPPRSAKRV